MGMRVPSLKRDGIASRFAIALNTLLSHVLIIGPAWSRWSGESRSGPAELQRYSSLIAALTSSEENGESRMSSSRL